MSPGRWPSGRLKRPASSSTVPATTMAPPNTSNSFPRSVIGPAPTRHSHYLLRGFLCCPIVEFGGKHFNLFNGRRLRKQFSRLGHQRGRHFSIEVRLAACFVGECIKDSKGGGTKANSKPCNGGGLLLNQRQTTL